MSRREMAWASEEELGGELVSVSERVSDLAKEEERGRGGLT